MNKSLIFLLIVCVRTLFSTSACIIIHGTWAQNESWYQPHGNFFKSVQRCAQELREVDVVLPFTWSGKLSYASQWEAANNLIKLIELYDHVILIGHSHGATVGIIASQMIGKSNFIEKNQFKIKKFYALGVPVEKTGKIYPDMSVVGIFYNFFSFGDYIQPINGAFGRIFALHERLANISVMFGDDHPSHGQLHDPLIGKELLKIEQYFADNCLGNFDNFSCQEPGLIQFFEYDLPWYSLHHDQKSLIELDKKVQYMMTMAFLRKQDLK